MTKWSYVFTWEDITDMKEDFNKEDQVDVVVLAAIPETAGTNYCFQRNLFTKILNNNLCGLQILACIIISCVKATDWYNFIHQRVSEYTLISQLDTFCWNSNFLFIYFFQVFIYFECNVWEDMSDRNISSRSHTHYAPLMSQADTLKKSVVWLAFWKPSMFLRHILVWILSM